ncbi:MAG: hypothetical protein ABI927_04625, partial [Gaiellaceae bacterium]
ANVVIFDSDHETVSARYDGSLYRVEPVDPDYSQAVADANGIAEFEFQKRKRDADRKARRRYDAAL